MLPQSYPLEVEVNENWLLEWSCTSQNLASALFSRSWKYEPASPCGLPCGLALRGDARLPCGDVVWKKMNLPCGRHTQRVPNFKGSDPVCCLRETDVMNRSAATAARFGCVSARLNEPLRGNRCAVWMCRSATYLSEI